MNNQFRLKTLLLGVAFIAAWLAGTMANVRDAENRGVDAVVTFGYCSPIWIPLLFTAYAIGRRSLGAKTLVAFGFAEAASLYVMSWAVYL